MAIWHSQDARMYSMSLALTTAPTWLMVLWLQRQRRWLGVTYVVVSWLALHTHYFAVFVLVAQNLFILIRTIEQPRLRTTFVNWLILQITIAFFYGPWLLRVQQILGSYDGNGDSPGFLAMLRRALSVFLVGESTPANQQLWWAWLAMLLVGVAFFMLWRQGATERRALLLLGCYLFVPLLATWWSALARPIFNERYVVAALPAFSLLVGVALGGWHLQQRGGVGSNVAWYTRFRMRPLHHALTLSLLVLTLSGALLSLQRYYTDSVYSKTRGWRDLAKTLTEWSAGLPAEQVRIAQNFPDPTLWYYYRGPVDHVVLPPGPHDMTGAAETVDNLRKSGVQRVILPRQSAPNWDDSEIAPEVLRQAFSGILEHQVGVWPVRLYQRKGTEFHPLAVRFQNGIELTGFQIAPTVLPANGLLVVFLNWQGQTSPPEGLKVFVQLLNEQGQLVAQDDRFFRESTSTTKQPAHYGILLPADLPSGAYRLITGLYDGTAVGTPRVLTTTGADFVEVTTFATEGIQ
ncbi:MAG: hypothetical protein R2867_33140 [Caldilineaceae bacterium]